VLGAGRPLGRGKEIELSESIDASDSAVASVASRSVAAWQPSPLALLSDAEFKERLEMTRTERMRIEAIQRSVMRENIDYGVIPGTDKPTLYKPGAEILNKMAGYTAEFYPERAEGDGITTPHIRYNVTCRLTDRNGALVAAGNGSANSWEKKHRWRGGSRVCPECGKGAIIKGQAKYGGGWLCWKKKDGCGAKFDDDAPEITSQSAEQIENADPYELDNTLLKMGEKRAYTDATLRGHAASGIFTQDVEDGDEPAAERPGKRAPEKAQARPSKQHHPAETQPAETGANWLDESVGFGSKATNLGKLGEVVPRDLKWSELLDGATKEGRRYGWLVDGLEWCRQQENPGQVVKLFMARAPLAIAEIEAAGA